MGVRWVVQTSPERAVTVEVLSDVGRVTRVRVEEEGKLPKELTLDLEALPGGRYLSRAGAGHVVVDPVRRPGSGTWAM